MYIKAFKVDVHTARPPVNCRQTLYKIPRLLWTCGLRYRIEVNTHERTFRSIFFFYSRQIEIREVDSNARMKSFRLQRQTITRFKFHLICYYIRRRRRRRR